MGRLSDPRLMEEVKRLRQENARLRAQAEGKKLTVHVLSLTQAAIRSLPFLGWADLAVNPWGMILRNVSVFAVPATEHKAGVDIAFPSWRYEVEGQTRYRKVVVLRNPQGLKAAARSVLKKYLDEEVPGWNRRT